MKLLTRTALITVLTEHGLILRGGWVPSDADALPLLPEGRSAAVVWMVGVAGSGFWPQFKTSSFYKDGVPDPLDRWSAHIGHSLADQYAGRALFPFDGPPFHPFQQWADRSEPTQSSALMLRIHPQFGLWHAYRFALALPDLAPEDAVELSGANASVGTDTCAQCKGQPCLTVCPVQAYTGSTFQVDACASHLHANPDGDCMRQGCQARSACPEGVEFRYTQEHAVFHMQAFARRH